MTHTREYDPDDIDTERPDYPPMSMAGLVWIVVSVTFLLGLMAGWIAHGVLLR